MQLVLQKNTVERLVLDKSPQRIVSLVPSQTELLYHLGLNEEVVGITKFCIHPNEWFRSKRRVGGTKTVNIDAVRALQPDLILANKEENVREQLEALQEIAPVWVSDINNLAEALEMITLVGGIVGKATAAEAMTKTIIAAFDALPVLERAAKAAYFIWRNPYMAAGGDTFINDMMRRCGLVNIFASRNRYPEVQIITDLNDCEYLLLSSEPYPFKQKHIDELQSLLPSTKIMLVDGEMFSWYGSRLLKAAEYFKEQILSMK